MRRSAASTFALELNLRSRHYKLTKYCEDGKFLHKGLRDSPLGGRRRLARRERCFLARTAGGRARRRFYRPNVSDTSTYGGREPRSDILALRHAVFLTAVSRMASHGLSRCTWIEKKSTVLMDSHNLGVESDRATFTDSAVIWYLHNDVKVGPSF